MSDCSKTIEASPRGTGSDGAVRATGPQWGGRLGASLLGLVLVAGAAGAGCTVHHVDPRPAPPIALAERFAPGEASEERLEAPDRWWRAFGDAELDDLVASALAGSLDLRRAWARLAQVAAVAQAAESGAWPQLTADAGLGGTRSVFSIGPPVGTLTNEQASYTLGLGARYEVDLWGRVAATEAAAAVDLRATREDLEASAMTIAGRAVDLWLQIAGERAGLALLEAQVGVARELVGLVELRFGQGLASALEVLQQRQQVAALEAQRPLAVARLEVAAQQLAVLTGRPPTATPRVTRDRLPALPPAPTTGLPIDLLGRRPDVRAAQLRAVAADHRIAAAVADRYPALALTGRTGFQSFDLAELFERWVWSLAANLTAPLFDGGRRSAEVDRVEAVRDEALLAYGQVLLQAVLEVESALASERQQREHRAQVEVQVALARQALAEAQRRYVHGLTDYLSVLTTQRTVQQGEQALLAAERQLLATRLVLYRALGGAWTRELQPTAPAGPPAPPRGDP